MNIRHCETPHSWLVWQSLLGCRMLERRAKRATSRRSKFKIIISKLPQPNMLSIRKVRLELPQISLLQEELAEARLID